jgi:hypothetical protein
MHRYNTVGSKLFIYEIRILFWIPAMVLDGKN